ncbi:uncharacterized protein LOC143144935 [Ptiloglossa arizonensis]|uniref:uncharacterized protein LOC143144935 n=1 Tax=Ptiloglossa arizonensis TaxID=3350558 RepID=UPI003FA02B7D
MESFLVIGSFDPSHDKNDSKMVGRASSSQRQPNCSKTKPEAQSGKFTTETSRFEERLTSSIFHAKVTKPCETCIRTTRRERITTRGGHSKTKSRGTGAHCQGVECSDTKRGARPQRGDEKPEWRPRKPQSPLGLRPTSPRQSAPRSTIVAPRRSRSRLTQLFVIFFRSPRCYCGAESGLINDQRTLPHKNRKLEVARFTESSISCRSAARVGLELLIIAVDPSQTA